MKQITILKYTQASPIMGISIERFQMFGADILSNTLDYCLRLLRFSLRDRAARTNIRAIN